MSDLLAEFGLVTEEELAALMGCSVKHLRNRAHVDLPAFVKAGRRRLYKKASVKAFIGLENEEAMS